MLEPILLLLLISLLVVAGWHDVRCRRIPNPISMAVFFLGVVYIITHEESGLVVGATAVSFVVLAIGIAAWTRGWLGAGDVKLIAALALWAGPGLILPMLLVIGIAGGALSLVQVWRRSAVSVLVAPLLSAMRVRLGGAGSAWNVRHVPPPVDADAQPNNGPGIPYGVAIAVGGVWLGWQLYAS